MFGIQNTRYKHPAPTFAGPIEELLTRKMNGDFAEINQTHNFLFYKRLMPTIAAPSVWIFQIPDDYYYHMDGFRSFWPLANGTEANDFQFKFEHIGRNRELSPTEIPARISTTPSFQQNARYMVKMNHTFFPSDKIKVRVNVLNGGLSTAEYCDVLIEGIRIPKNFIIQE